MGPPVDIVASDSKLPPRADVVVIGGGIIGVCSAMFLAERGLSVVVVEKGEIGAEQSSRNWGWCRQAMRDPREFDLIRESLQLWRGMNARIGAETGFRTTGILFAARDDKTEHQYTEWVRRAADSGIESLMTHGSALARLLPGDTSPPRAALYCAGDGRAEPQWAAPAIALRARRSGATIMTNCAARGIETGGGHVLSVVTEHGPIACETAIVAGGAWSRRILKDLGIPLPQLKVRGSVARTTRLEGGPETTLWDDLLSFRKRADGGYTVADGRTNAVPITPDGIRYCLDFAPILIREWKGIHLTLDERFFVEWRESAKVALDRPSPYEATRILDPKPDEQYLNAAMAAMRRRYPVFADVRIAASWAGFIDATPDAVPVISYVEGISGLIVATGFSGHGFGIAPGAGHLVADLVCGAAPIVDPSHFEYSRYFDGSKPRPTTGV